VALDPTLVDARMSLLQFYLQAPGVMGGSTAKAREQAQALLGLNPVQGRIAFATIASREKDWAGVERELVALVREQPDSGRGAAALANFYADRSRPDEAFRTYDQWLARHPRDALGLYGIGRTAAVTGQQLERGAQALTQLLALPESARDAGGISAATALWRLGMIHEKAGRTADAKAAYTEAVRLAPDLRGAREGLKRLG
jgi:tetratricopeptide (TPR) repeat protein